MIVPRSVYVKPITQHNDVQKSWEYPIQTYQDIIRTVRSKEVQCIAGKYVWEFNWNFAQTFEHPSNVKNVLQSFYIIDEIRCTASTSVNYNWINQLSNTTIWWLGICCLLHRYQLHVSALMAIFRLIDWKQTCKQLYFGMRLVYGGGGLGLDGGTRSLAKV